MARILFLSKTDLHGQGGAETRLREVARRLVSAGHAVYVLCATTDPDTSDSEVWEGVHVQYIRVLPRCIVRRLRPGAYLPQAMFYLVSPLAVLSAIRRFRIDVIRDSMSPFPALGLLAPFLARRSVVVTHILFGDYRQWRRHYGAAYGLFGYIAERLLLAGYLPYTCVITDSTWLANALRRGRNRVKRVRSILNGIDCRQFVARAAGRNEIRRVLNVARCTVHKRQCDLLEACAILTNQGRRIEMSIAGDGPLRPALEATARRLGIQHVVRFLGSVPFAQMRQLYAEHDLLAVTSESEGLPVAVLEGMASRVPVVAPEVPFITEMTPNAGRMVATFQLGNTESLVKAIVRLMDNPELVDEMEAIAWDWVQSLTWDATASEEWEEMSLI